MPPGDGIGLHLLASTAQLATKVQTRVFANYSSPFFDSGDVLFAGGLANLASVYFSLDEEAVTTASFTGPIIVKPVLGPIVGAGFPGGLTALGGFPGWHRRRRRNACPVQILQRPKIVRRHRRTRPARSRCLPATTICRSAADNMALASNLLAAAKRDQCP